MAAEDCWVFDSLVCFLHGPIWNAPLQTFIEEKSLVFDPNIQPDAAAADVIKIHEEYKHLVDYMLGSFMEEMHITPEQFEMACIEGGGGGQRGYDGPAVDQHSFHFHQGLFQQIWAANDINIFIRMMTQRNVELQLQALDLIEKNQLALLHHEDGDSGHAGAVTPLDNTSPNNESDVADVEEFIRSSMERELASPEAALTPETDDNTADGDVADKFERLNLFFEKSGDVSADDVSSRHEYLRQQRDKILEIKKKTRAKQLMETMARQSSTEAVKTGADRPSSALVAQRLLENGVDGGAGGSATGDGGASGTDLSTAMQLRKMLAKRLRAEVVEQK